MQNQRLREVSRDVGRQKICISIMVKALGDHQNKTEIEQLGNRLFVC